MVKSCFCRCEMYSDVCIEMKILILYSAIGSMATVDSALFSSSAIRVIKMVVLPLLYISLNLSLAKLVMGHISTLSILQLTIQQSPPMTMPASCRTIDILCSCFSNNIKPIFPERRSCAAGHHNDSLFFITYSFFRAQLLTVSLPNFLSSNLLFSVFSKLSHTCL